MGKGKGRKIVPDPPAAKATAPAGEAAPTAAAPEAKTNRRSLLGAASVLVLGGTGLTIAWNYFGDQIRLGSAYWLEPSAIQVSSQPPWIRSDVRAEVLRTAGLDARVSVLEERLSERIAQAFALHPWVARVAAVKLQQPAGATVELEYREPVLMVEVPGGLYPVDWQAVLLPSGDFSPVEAAKFPRLGEVSATPSGPVGANWGDARVQHAAALAALLKPHWQTWKLRRMVPIPRSVLAAANEPPGFLLIPQHGRFRVLWGFSPLVAQANEPAAADKLARLQQFMEQHRDPTSLDAGQDFDLRTKAAAQLVPQVAAEPRN